MKWALGTALLVVGWAGVAHARSPAAELPDALDSCVEGYERGQLAERRGRFIEAREQLARCLAPACPAKLKAECAPLLDDVGARTPTVILVCTNASDDLSRLGQVVVDDRPHLADGRAFEIDPGEHVFRLQSVQAPETLRRTVVEGGKGQRVAFACRGIEPPPVAAISASRPVVLAGTLAAVAAIGLGTFGYFGIDGLSSRAELEACRSHCSDRDVDAVERSFLVADVALGVAIVAGVAASIVWWTSPGASSKAQASRRLVPGSSF